MNASRLLTAIVLATLSTLLLSSHAGMAQGPDTPQGVAPDASISTGFTYQGSLRRGSYPVNDTCAIRFSLWDAAGGGNRISDPIERTASVREGVFTVYSLDFGVLAFTGSERWLEVAVRCQHGDADFVALSPRQSISAAPYALGLRPNARVEGEVPSSYAFLGANFSQTGPTEGIRGMAWGPRGTGVVGWGDQASGGKFSSNYNQALVTFGPSLLDGRNRMQIATERWYAARSPDFSTTVNYPGQMVFDGDHIWVISYIAAQVVKVRASDMVIVTSYGTSLDNFPTAIAYDGANVWVASGSNKINKIRASDGVIVGNITGYYGHQYMIFDGEYIWVNNSDHNSISRIRARDATMLGTYGVGRFPQGLAFDGANIWVANRDDDTVSKLRASDGAVLGTYAVGDGPRAVVFDGRHIWVSNSQGGSLSKLRASDGYNAGTASVAAPGEMVFDGYSIWVLSGSNPASLVQVRAYDGTVTSTRVTLVSPTDIAFDGNSLWVSHVSSNRLVKQ